MIKKTFTIDRLSALMATRRLMMVSPSAYNTEVLLRPIDGKLSMSSFGEGIIALELLRDSFETDEEIVINLDKFYTFLKVRHENEIVLTVNPKTIKLTAGLSSATISRSTIRLVAGIPSKDALVGEVSASVFDDLARVGNISDDKDSARPLLGGVFLMASSGDIRSVAANGIAFGYAWEQNQSIASDRETFLVKATAMSIAQRYDWQGEPRIQIYRPSNNLRMVCFTNGLSYLYVSELAEKEKFPIDALLNAAKDSVSVNSFYVDSSSFKNYIEAAVKISEYDDRSVTVALANERVMVSSGKRLKSEIEEKGLEFQGFFEVMESSKAGEDFIFCLDAKMVKQMISLLEQVDKGQLRVAMGKETKLIFFSTPLANALYAISQIAR